eukprot:SAG31_NODE_44310_length_263_cov_0.859756_1_plen_64_part_01
MYCRSNCPICTCPLQMARSKSLTCHLETHVRAIGIARQSCLESGLLDTIAAGMIRLERPHLSHR